MSRTAWAADPVYIACRDKRRSRGRILTHTVSGYFPSGRSRVSAFSLWTQPCQGIILLDTAESGHFPSGRSHVRAFCFWTQPYRGIFLLDASGRHMSWHHYYTGCQGMEHRSKYSGRLCKHAAGSRHCDSVQFYSLYLRYVHLYMLLHTSCFQQKHPASHPSPRSSHAVMLF